MDIYRRSNVEVGVLSVVKFVSSTGREYEIQFSSDWGAPFSGVDQIVESDDGSVTAMPRGDKWESLIEMTHALKVEIVSVDSDPGN